MPQYKSVYPLIVMALSMLLSLPAALRAADEPAAVDNTTIQLGKVQVTGRRAILETLQDIKVSLRRPYSTDPKLADVVVCRIDDVAGSNAKKWLTCGTNRNLAKNRDALHSTMQSVTSTNPGAGGDGHGGGSTACDSASCYTDVVGAINTVLDNEPAKYLHVQVNGAAFHALLDKIADPGPTPAPQAVTTPAPTAATAQ